MSYNELSQLVQCDIGTVIKYIDLLEQSFVIFGLHSFSRNARNELKKAKKYYFRDTGLRNGLLRNFAPLAQRTDKGALRENFMIVERIKFQHNSLRFPHRYFWRTTTQQEIDYIEESNGQLHLYEIKSSQKKKPHVPSTFAKHYDDYTFHVLTPETLWDYV